MYGSMVFHAVITQVYIQTLVVSNIIHTNMTVLHANKLSNINVSEMADKELYHGRQCTRFWECLYILVYTTPYTTE